MSPNTTNATYREPLEPPRSADSLDASLAREIYETRHAEELKQETKEQNRKAKEQQRRMRRRQRVEVVATEPHPCLTIRKTHSERVGALFILAYFASLVLLLPVSAVALAPLVAWSTTLTIIGIALLLVTAYFGIRYVRSLWPQASRDSLRLRVTPLHFELIEDGHRHVGERDELALDASDDSVLVQTLDNRFRIDELHPADVQTITHYFHNLRLKVS